MRCNNCGFEIKFSEAVFCPNCGAKTGINETDENATRRDENIILHDISHIWPEWKLVKLLGKGSYGRVYEAVRSDSGIESRAAIKIISIPTDQSEIDSLRAEGLDNNSTREYFRHVVEEFVEEIRLMESFKGVQNIVSVEDYKVVEKMDDIGWDIYIRMELLTPFNSYTSDKKLTEREIIKLGIDIATALEMCSRKNVIHRDIKPENIFINDFGYFKLGDFGVARTLENKTSGLSQKGTYNFMAPEVIYFKDYDARVDIYSLGVMLYKLLNDNRIPFLSGDKQIFTFQERKEALDRRMAGEVLPPPCKASAPVAHIILKACAFNVQDRFATATELKEALTAVLQGRYTGHLDNTLQIPDYDKTVAAKRADAEKKPEYVNSPNVYPVPEGDFANNPADNSIPSEQKNKSYVSIIAIAIALGLLTGILVGGIVLLVKFSSGDLSLHIDPVAGIFNVLKNLMVTLRLR